MSASISYKIGGKFDSTPLNQAQKGIEKLSKAASAMKLAVGGFVVGAALKGLKSVVEGSSAAFVNQNKALTAVNKSFANNNKLSVDSINNIKSAMNGLSMNNFIDGDTLNNAAALASNMGLNETQIIKVVDAAKELSAATGQDLNSCVKQLSLSYDGNVASLKKIVPEIGNLTDEEIKNGKAIELIKEKYNGFSETMSKTFDGRSKQFANTFDDLKASIGGVFQALSFVGQGKLLEPLQKVTSFIEEHRNQIINFFLNLPEIAGTAIVAVKDCIARTLTADGLLDLGKYLVGTISNWIPVVTEFFKSCGEILLGVFDVTYGNLGRLFYNKVIISIKEAFQNLINDFVREHPTIADWIGLDKIQLDMTPKAYATFSSYTTKASQNIEKAKQNAQESIRKQAQLNANFASKYADITNKATGQIKTILNKDLPEDLQIAFNAGGEAIAEKIAEADFKSDTTTNTNFDTSINAGVNGLSTLTSMIQTLGEVGQAVALALSENWIGLILMLIAKLVSALQSSSEKFSVFMESISMILSLVAETIAPIIEEIIQPFLDSMKSVADILGSILTPIFELASAILTPILNLINQLMQILAPIIKIIGTLLSLFVSLNPLLNIFGSIIKIMGDILKAVYNFILVPVVNFLLKIITAIGNFFIKMYNGVVGVLNDISIFGWHPFDFSKKSELNYNEMALEKIEDYATYDPSDFNYQAGSSSKASNSASYTAARDIYITINYSNSYVNGDAREIALNLRNEIRAAEKLGY